MTSYQDLIHQMAPLSVVLTAVKEDANLQWPGITAQEELTAWFLSNSTYPLSEKYLNSLLKALQKSITEVPSLGDAEEETFSDSFIEFFLSRQNNQPFDEEDTGYLQYQILNSRKRLPIMIKRSHNQVGTKVWSAGLVLAELLQWELGPECSDLLRDKTFVELGAGVGITSLLWYLSLPSDSKMKGIVITDYADSVMDIVSRNVSIAKDVFSDDSADSVITPLLFDWTDVTPRHMKLLSDAHCLLAADCTYSPDLNTALVSLFHLYFKTFLAYNSIDYDALESFFASTEMTETGELPFVGLLSNNVPFVLIACTMRNEATFGHFVDSLNEASDVLSYQLVTACVHSKLENRHMYFIPDRSAVETFCIYPCISLLSQYKHRDIAK